ncbi:Gfo/Idh/MocA family protein [Auraticoccus cholistanensis]|uniref:Gfo/Idh/MocA family protein n=1 Tax=Auraticoccus cholistanensis TaxID=2656650 RepID=UPI002F90AA19
MLGIKLVAVCDLNEVKLEEFKQAHPEVEVFTDYDEFLQFQMDAVVVANYFHQHVPFAIKALRAGKHVMSETQACKTLQEGVELCREVEKSGLIYMFAENYPYFATNQEMRRLYQQGVVGEVRYAEGEYVHPMPPRESMRIAPGLDHWRNNMPPTYYCTHAVAPLMYITDTRPVSVNALAIAATDDQLRTRVKTSDPGAVILCRMDNGAVFRILTGGFAGYRNYYRVHGFEGRLDNVSNESVRVVRNAWEIGPEEHEEIVFKARFPRHEELAQRAGHGGGDFWTSYHFAEAIRSGQQPYLDVYRAVAMSVVGILAWKSALQDGAAFDLPDFRDEEQRKLHEDDDWSPWPEDRRPGQPWPSVRGQLVPSDAAVAEAEKIWKETGYLGL